MRLFLVIVPVASLVTVYAGLAGRVLQRADARGLEDGRFCVMPGIIRATEDSWPLGAGLTRFRDVFPAYRNPTCGITGVWDKAHNFYAEGLLSIGILFPALLILVLAVLVAVFVKGYRARQRLRYVGAVGLSSLILVALHSGFDFSLQIPGFATFFAALIAPIVTICLSRPRRGATRSLE